MSSAVQLAASAPSSPSLVTDYSYNYGVEESVASCSGEEIAETLAWLLTLRGMLEGIEEAKELLTEVESSIDYIYYLILKHGSKRIDSSSYEPELLLLASEKKWHTDDLGEEEIKSISEAIAVVMDETIGLDQVKNVCSNICEKLGCAKKVLDRCKSITSIPKAQYFLALLLVLRPREEVEDS